MTRRDPKLTCIDKKWRRRGPKSIFIKSRTYGRILVEKWKIWLKISNLIRYSFKCSLKFDQNLRHFDKNKIFHSKTGRKGDLKYFDQNVRDFDQNHWDFNQNVRDFDQHFRDFDQNYTYFERNDRDFDQNSWDLD